MPSPLLQCSECDAGRGSNKKSVYKSNSGEKGSSSGENVVWVSSGTKSFGKTSGRKPDGIKVNSNGDCEMMEYAGGFDGYFSVDAGDGHEDGLAQAVKEMLRENGAKIGKSAGKNNSRNTKVNKYAASPSLATWTAPRSALLPSCRGF